jgi:hypothetical protein
MAPDAPEKELEKAAKKNDVEGIVAACEALRAAPSEKGVKALIKFGAGIANIDVYLACRDALAAAKDGKAQEELLEAAGKGKSEQRVLCLDALGYQSDPKALAALTEALAAKEQPVRTTAIRGLVRTKKKEAVNPLLDRLAKFDLESSDAEVDELARGLRALTGQAFETLEDWRKWWSTVEADFDPTKVGAAPEGGTKQREPPTGNIFGSEVRSKKFVLCLDISSSMRVIDLEPGKKWKDKDGKDHDYEDPGTGWPPKETSRFARARSEFVSFVNQLDGRTRFTIVVFGDECKVWQEQLVPANDGNKKSAVDFVQKLQWGPATRTDLALEKCFAVAEADTIYMFSDGIPEKYTNGKSEDIPQADVLKLAQTLNRVRKARLNTFGFATVSPQTREFLRKLASENEGEYKDIR